ncbi:hypothetical protein [Chryseobacterium sp. G0201]|uniref:hypothetical protein n=1 Tax=Chryseobacterium sp. G0201 TaxID=2487065 RepID=UPI000F50B3C8|nr:hypothetical protein [Chryseobacterium sp. G0201]AZA54295.1 hypothetical protein EG348_15475 [Chryseobacterium sp. G0201]
MKFNILTLGVLSLIIFSCDKSNKTSQSVNKNTDSLSVITKTDSLSSQSTSPENIPVKEMNEKFTLIKKSKQTPGDINKADIDKLSEPLKAIAALYSGLGGSNCSGENCELTTALGLGKQGSQAQKDLVKKWFSNNKAAEQLISQDFYQSPNTASNFSDYEYLTFEQNGDTITVNYDLLIYNHGQSTNIKGPDKYVIKGNIIETVNRNIWKDVK